MKKLYIIGLLALGFVSCKPKINPQKPIAGNIDLTSYIAVGGSFTAGFSDGSLYKSGQMNSYPAIISRQLNTIMKSEFVQPYLPGEYGYPKPKFILGVIKGPCDTIASVRVTPFLGALDSATSGQSITWQGPFHNTAVPGIRCIDFIATGYGNFNPYAKRFFQSPGTDKPIHEIIKKKHTFFTLWIGPEDVLGYAMAGGDGSLNPTEKISNTDEFAAAYDSVARTLTLNGEKGVLINIPDILTMPFFNAIPPNGLTLTKAEANDLNDMYNTTDMRFHEGGGNYFVIRDTTAPFKMRQVKDGEYILLSVPQDSIKCSYVAWGTKKPMPEKYVLTASEVAKVKDAIIAFNNVIDQQSVLRGIPVVDMFSFMQTLQSGVKFNGVSYSAAFAGGGAYSLDGVHMTPRGYALIANHIIAAINNNYGGTIPYADVNNYNGVLFP